VEDVEPSEDKSSMSKSTLEATETTALLQSRQTAVEGMDTTKSEAFALQ
jgi:hypothetical protein